MLARPTAVRKLLGLQERGNRPPLLTGRPWGLASSIPLLGTEMLPLALPTRGPHSLGSQRSNGPKGQKNRKDPALLTGTNTNQLCSHVTAALVTRGSLCPGCLSCATSSVLCSSCCTAPHQDSSFFLLHHRMLQKGRMTP